MKRTLAIGIALLTGTLLGCVPAEEGGGDFDLVIANGRVVDPESGLDAVRSIGIRGGSIAAIVDGGDRWRTDHQRERAGRRAGLHRSARNMGSSRRPTL